MTMPDLVSRSQLAGRLRLRKASLAHAVTTEFLERHPEFVARYGSRGYQRGIEDAGYHLDFLAAAVEAGSPALFSDYLRWTARVLSARGIGVELLLENVQQVMKAVLADEEAAAGLLIRRIRDDSLALLTGPELPEPTEAHPGFAASRALFIEAVLRGDRRPALQLALDALQQGLDTATLYVELFQRTMHDIGRRWESNRVSVAQEHMATATVQYVVAQLYARLQLQPATRGKALITGVEGEHHQLGANLVADVLEAGGFDVRFLGSDVPEAAVLRAVEHERPTLIGVSTTMAFNLPKAISLVRALQAGQTAGTPRIMLGGAAFASAPRLAEELGVLGIGHDVGQALALACSE